jgi:NADH-quinone oxidoreductase subunit A
MLQHYFPILLLMMVGMGIGLGPIILGSLLGPRNPSPAKYAPYECGFEPFHDARLKFDVRFYLVAILFIIFDLEVAFLFPWAVVMRQIGWYGFIAMGVFFALLMVGFLYEWRKGALEWE